MRQFILFTCILLTKFTGAQSFASVPGEPGSTAIYKDSSIIVNWANGITFQRGYLNISDKSLGFASFGDSMATLGPAEGNSFDVVSFGDSGVAILTFPQAIVDGPGFDFAVFENGFADNYVEYAFVEVSSNGVDYFRFPAISETPTDVQMSSFEYSDCRYVNNLAGKYRQGFGTPFDLGELPDDSNLDKNAITHVKIIDVVGSIDTLYGSFDSQGTIINDPWPSAFESGGFDLDAIAVINQSSSGLKEVALDYFVALKSKQLDVKNGDIKELQISNAAGQVLLKKQGVKVDDTVDLTNFSGFVILSLNCTNGLYHFQLFI